MHSNTREQFEVNLNSYISNKLTEPKKTCDNPVFDGKVKNRISEFFESI